MGTVTSYLEESAYQSYLQIAAKFFKLQGGSNMTGTVCV